MTLNKTTALFFNFDFSLELNGKFFIFTHKCSHLHDDTENDRKLWSF